MNQTTQPELWQAEKVAAQATLKNAPNGLRYANWGETRLPDADLEQMVGAVPALLAPALAARAYFFVPLAMGEEADVMVSPEYSIEYGDRAICHRNVSIGPTEAVFLSSRMVDDRFGLAFEFFINVAHNFVDAAGVPEGFSSFVWKQAEAQIQGETSQDAWETRKAIFEQRPTIDERARTAYYEAAFSDTLAIYMLAIALDFDYRDLRERDYPLIPAPALADRLRLIATLFPANPGYEFQILYRRKG